MGEVTAKTDRNANVHEYAHDLLVKRIRVFIVAVLKAIRSRRPAPRARDPALINNPPKAIQPIVLIPRIAIALRALLHQGQLRIRRWPIANHGR